MNTGRIALLAFTTVIASSACGGDDSDSGPDNSSANERPNVEGNAQPNIDENIYPGVDFTTAMVSASDGATVMLDSGRASIDIPPGALSEDTEVTLRLNRDITSYSGLVPNGGSAGPAAYTVNIEPAGTALTTPATVTMVLTADELSAANRDDQVWRFGLATNGSGEDTIIDAAFADAGTGEERWRITAEIGHFGDLTAIGVGKITLQPDCTECSTGTEHAFVVDVENILAPTAGFVIRAEASDPVVFTTAETTGVAAPMTHEFPELAFECTEPGASTITIDYSANLGSTGPTFGWGIPLSSEISCL